MPNPTIRLTEEKETLLVPLYSKAIECRRERPIICDAKAVEILESVDYDFQALRVPRQSLVTLAMRAKKLDCYVSAYLSRSAAPLVIHLGCGLDSRILRVAADIDVDWFDIDFPEVIELRRKFFDEHGRYHMLGRSVTDWSWIAEIVSLAGDKRPAMIVAEGLLMYLEESDVKMLFEKIRESFPGSEFAFDAYSVITARSAGRHPSIKKTGAQIHWGVDDARSIEKWGDGIRLFEEWAFPESEDIEFLPRGFRMLFRIAGAFPAARRAHRILRFQL